MPIQLGLAKFPGKVLPGEQLKRTGTRLLVWKYGKAVCT